MRDSGSGLSGGSTGKGRGDGPDEVTSGLVKALALAAQLGFSIACPMVVFIGGGAWLDNKIGWGPWLTLLGIFAGVATAGYLFYQIATMPSGGRTREPGARKAPYKVEQHSEPGEPGTPRADESEQDGEQSDF